MFGYLDIWREARALPLRLTGRDLVWVLRHVDEAAPQSPPADAPSVDTIERWIRRATKGPWLMRKRRCMRHGILAYRFLRRAGHAPVMKFSVDPASVDAPSLGAHCWVEVDGRAVVNGDLPNHVTILTHSPDHPAAGFANGLTK